MKWLIIAIVVLGAILAWQLLQRRFGISMVRMRVGSDEDGCYQVVVDELQPMKRSAEHVRVLLGSAAGLLYWIDRKCQESELARKEFLENLEVVADLPLTPDADLPVLVGWTMEVTEVASLTTPQRLKATLHYQNLAYRFVNVERIKSRDVRQLTGCWIAMAALALKKWDQKLVDRFSGSLRALIDIYRADSDHLTMQSVIHYPNRAFLQYMTGTNTDQ